MTNYEIYVFVLCFVVFTLLTATFSYLIYLYARQELELIRNGHRDEQIRREYERKNRPLHRTAIWVSRLLSVLTCLAFAAAFAFALHLRANEEAPIGEIPAVKVVRSNSMKERNEKNQYLFENDLNNQFDMFDMILCEQLPAEEDLKLYDIVVYKQKDMYIIHRIIGIEEPNEAHPNERHFLLRGDSSEYSDKFPVLYSQMQGIYHGTRVPYVGSFIMFLQSPAGWMCMLLIVFAIIIAPIAERILENARKERLGYGYQDEDISYPERRAASSFNPIYEGMTTYYNRPGSPYSEPFQRQDQLIPYRHSQNIDYFSRYEEKRNRRK